MCNDTWLTETIARARHLYGHKGTFPLCDRLLYRAAMGLFQLSDRPLEGSSKQEEVYEAETFLFLTLK